MADTYTANVVASSLAERVDYIRELQDEIVAKTVKTSSMTANPRIVEGFGAAGEVKIKTIDFTNAPLSDMGENGTYPIKNKVLTWASYKLAYDEGAAFDLGHTQGEKAGIGEDTANTISEYTRQVVVPRIDKVRLARLVEYAKNSETGTLTKADIYSAIKTGLKTIAENYSVEEGCTIYMSYDAAAMLEASTELTNVKNIKDAGRSLIGRVDSIDGNSIVRVPADYLSGATFAIHAPGTIQGISEVSIKHVPSQYNTRGNGDFVGYEVYHDAICFENAKAGLYAYKTTTTSG